MTDPTIPINPSEGIPNMSEADQIISSDPPAPLEYFDPSLIVTFFKPNPTTIPHQCFTPLNSSPQMTISGNILSNKSGYCLARTSYPTVLGNWYYELKIVEPSEHHENLPQPHWRLGWATEKADKDCPVGFDIYSYSWRDDGTLFHQARPYTWYLKKKGTTDEAKCEGYGPGDVLGFLISVTEELIPEDEVILSQKNEFATQPKEPPQIMKGSSITLFKNGVRQKGKFVDIYKGDYYPAVSMYYNATIEANLGPDFAYRPEGLEYNPVSKLNEMYIVKE